MDDNEETRPTCSCEKSTCVKRYCNCFGNRWYCSENCTCTGCLNSTEREAYVEERAEMVLKKKPGAFRSKIEQDAGPSSSGGEQRRHVKGCNCTRSQCAMRYCECFKHDVACTARCKCEGCANTRGARDGNGANGASDGSDESPGSSNGTSNETAVTTDEELPCPTEAGVTGNVAAFADPRDSDQQIHGLSASGLDAMLLNFVDESYLHSNVHPEINHGAAQAVPHDGANSAPQGPANPDTCNINNDSQNGFGGS